MNPSPAVPDAPLQWRTAPSVIRVWAFSLCLFSLLGCAVLLMWGIRLFGTSVGAAIAATGGGLLLSAFFGVLLLAIRRGWRFGWPLQLGYSVLFLVALLLAATLKWGFARAEEFPTNQKLLIALALVPAIAHVRIVAGWFKAEVRAWFGDALKVL